jgi:TM2 domain-containing membrane protein YozV
MLDYVIYVIVLAAFIVIPVSLWFTFKSNDLTERESKKNLSHNKEVKMKYCPNCGTEVEKMQYCSNCGTNLQTGNPNSYQSQPKSQVIALLLFLFLGEFGAHRFYVGKIGTGILMLLSFPFLIFSSYLINEDKMANVFETGRKLSETGNTIVIIGCGLAIIFVIVLISDFISILTGSFTKAYNSECVNSGNGEPIRTKDKGSRIRIIVFFLLLAFLIFFIISYNYVELSKEQQKNAAEERTVRYIDSLVRENSLRYVPTVPQKKKAGNSKKTYGVQLAPEQPQEVLKIQKGTKGLEYQKLQK